MSVKIPTCNIHANNLKLTSCDNNYQIVTLTYLAHPRVPRNALAAALTPLSKIFLKIIEIGALRLFITIKAY